jgi:hypothetical protein
MGVKWLVFEAPSHAEISNVYLHFQFTICPHSMDFKQAWTQLNLSHSNETKHSINSRNQVSHTLLPSELKNFLTILHQLVLRRHGVTVRK